MRHRPLLTLLAALTLLTVATTPAQANWLALPGLNGAAGASFVREYATGTPQSIFYAATEGGGVMRSTTNGVTWETFNGGLLGIPGAMDVRTVFTSGTTVYAGTSAGLFKSEGSGSFQPVAQGPEVDPKHPKKLNQAVQTVFTGYKPGQMIAGVASGGIYRSTDNGATWTPPAPGNGMVRSETVWSIGSFADELLYAATQSGIYVSTDGGATWTLSNDGISGITLRAWADDKFPNIYYAAGTDGLFRSINFGLTWSNVEGPAGHRLDGGTVRAIKQFSGINEKRIYAGTANGVYAGMTGNSAAPGPVSWRKVTNNGFVNPIIWALTSYINTPGTLMAGTQGSGGYALTFVAPHLSSGKPALKNLSPKVGETLSLLTHGNWGGTPTIEFEYQWQDCTGTCADIDGATESTFVVPAQNRKYRVQVIAKNDFPTLGLVSAYSDPTNASGPKPGSLPGDSTSNTAKIKVIPDSSFPQSGQTLQAYDWSFSPGETTRTFQWFHCAGADCTPIEGATSQNYALTDEDVTKRLCVTVTGTNASGSKTLGCSGTTNEIFPKNPKSTGPTTMAGSAYVGEALVSGVGTWEFAGTQFARQWEACNADGGSCATISGAKGSTYVVKAAELGKRLRVRISVDSNVANKFPAPIEVFTPLSAVVTTPPPPPADPQPQGGGGGAGGGGGTPQPQGGGSTPPPPPPADTVAPIVSTLTTAASKIKSGAALSLKLNLSEAGSLSVSYQRVRAGRKQGKKCKLGGKKGKPCTVVSNVATFSVPAGAGASMVALPKRKLPVGDYRAVVTPVDAAGNRGAAKTVSFKIKR